MEKERFAPKFSLIVATLGRTDPLRDMFRSLTLESVKDFEVIVVDQNLDDRIEPIVREFRDAFPIIHVRSQPGLSRARNVGIKLAKGEILAFPDDDCQYTGATLDTVLRAFHMEKVDIVCGLYGENGHMFVPHPKYLGWGCRSLNSYNTVFLVSSVGLFIKRQAIEHLLDQGPFNESMGAGARVILGEEQELVVRLLTRGSRGRFVPTVWVYHKIERAKPRKEVDYALSFLLARLFKISLNPFLGIRMTLRVLRAFAELLLPSRRASFLPKIKGMVDGLMSK